MIFKETQAIYLQIANWVCEQILLQKWAVSERALSVRELGSRLEVNPNTALRAYDYLQKEGIIENKRGVGYFVSEEAVEKIHQLRKAQFLETELPLLFKTMEMLEIGVGEMEQKFLEWKDERKPH